MLKKILLALLVFSILMISAACVCAVDLNDSNASNEIENLNYVENNCEIDLQSPNDSNCSESPMDNPFVFEGTTFSELKDTLETLKKGNTIVLSNNITQDGNDPIIIRNPVIVDGKGITMDAKNLSSAFVIFSDNVVLKNIKFINGRTAIQWLGLNGTVKDCIFENNVGYNKGMIELVNTTDFTEVKLVKEDYEKIGFEFTNNKLLSGMDWEEYAKLLEPIDVVDFYGTTFSQLEYQLIRMKDGDTLILHNDLYQNMEHALSIRRAITINGNGHKLDGKNLSGIMEVSGDNVALYDIKFVNCHTAIMWEGRKGTVKACEFMDSSDSKSAVQWFGINGYIKNCTFKRNEGSKGGALHLSTVDCKIEGCDFYENKAIDGGAIRLEYVGLWGFICNVTITACKFVQNVAKENGGAIFGVCRNVNVNDCLFLDNSAHYGGAINFISDDGNIISCTFEKNHAINGNGGAIFWTGYRGNVKLCDFGYNTADEKGGAIYWNWDTQTRGTIYDCDFYMNKAKDGIIYSFCEKSQYGTRVATIDCIRCNFLANTAAHIVKCEFYGFITNCIFFKNNGVNFEDGLYRPGQAYVTRCWFGNTRSNMAVDMSHMGKYVIINEWYILANDFSTYKSQIYHRHNTALKKIQNN